MTTRFARLSVAVGIAILLCHCLPSLAVAQDEQLDGSRWTLVAPSSTSLPSVEPPAAFSRSGNDMSPSGVASYLNDARPSRLETNKFFSSFLINGPSRIGRTLPYVITINDVHPYGKIVSFPNFFSGATNEEDGRLKWYGNAVKKDCIMSATELHDNQDAVLTDLSDEGLSATIMFHAGDEYEGHMDAYLARGMACATVYYEAFTPDISSIHSILSVNERINRPSRIGWTLPYVVTVNDVHPYEKIVSFPNFFSGATNEEDGRLKWYGNAVNKDCIMSATELHDNQDAVLTDLSDEGLSATIMFHAGHEYEGHMDAYLARGMDPLSSDAMTGLFLGSPTKGDMQRLGGSNWTFLEDLPTFHWVPPVCEINRVKEMEWIDYFLEKERPQQLDYAAGASVYFGAKNLMAYAQLCLVAGERGRDDLEAFCVDQVEAGLVFYTFSTNGNPLVYDTKLESNVKSTSGVWRTVLSMSYTVVHKHLEEMPSSGVGFGLRRAWALYGAAIRPDCALYCNHDETTIPAALPPTPAPVVASGAYLDSPAIIPGTVEVFRLDEDVDSKPTPTSGFYAGWTAGGERMSYTVDVQMDGHHGPVNVRLCLPTATVGPKTRVSTVITLSTSLLLACVIEFIIRRLLSHHRPTAALSREEATPGRRRPLRPMTPFGVDPPEDRPSAVRLRNAAHYAVVRRDQERDARQAVLEVGRDLHEKHKWEHARKAKQAKQEAALQRQVAMIAIVDEKMAKAAKAARERAAFKEEYAKALAERQRDMEKKKQTKAIKLAERRADMYEQRERRLTERARQAHARRSEARMIF